MRILLVENRTRDRDETKRLFEEAGFFVDAVGNEKSALDFARDSDYVAGVFDLHLTEPPMKREGLELIARVKKLGKKFPILVLSMDGTDESELMARKHGAEGYVAKHRKSEYLLFHLRNMISSPEGDSLLLTHGPITLSIRDCKVHVDGRRVFLRRHEFALLEYLMTVRKPVPLKAIAYQIWEEVLVIDEKTRNKVHVLVSNVRNRLRKKLPNKEIDPIPYVRELGGYRLWDFTNEEE